MTIYKLNNVKPSVGERTWIAPSAEIIGDVSIGKNCFIGFGSVIRGDFGPIVIGDESLIEDNVVIHAATRTKIGSRVIVGHMAMIHDATIEDGALIGMKAMICEKSVIGQGAIVAEQTLVRKNQRILPGKIYAGTPAKIKREVSKHHREILNLGIQAYIDLAQLYRQTLKIVDL